MQCYISQIHTIHVQCIYMCIHYATYFPCVPSQFPNRMYPRPGYPAHSPAQPSGGPPTPTYSPHQAPPIAPPTVGPPPYGTAGQPSTPTDSGYFGSVPNMHHMSGPVPSPLSKGVSGTVYILQCVMLVVRSVFVNMCSTLQCIM